MATVPFDRSTLPTDQPGKRRKFKLGDLVVRVLFWLLVIFILIYTRLSRSSGRCSRR